MTTDMQRLNTLVHEQLLQWSGKNKKYIPITVKNLLTFTPNNVE